MGCMCVFVYVSVDEIDRQNDVQPQQGRWFRAQAGGTCIPRSPSTSRCRRYRENGPRSLDLPPQLYLVENFKHAFDIERSVGSTFLPA